MWQRVWLDAITLSGAPDPCARALAPAGVPYVRVPIAGDALVMGAVRQVETIDDKAIADVELIERQRQGIRSREVASARHGKW